MNDTFITEIKIEKVRHLHDITIPLSQNKCKHLILTGKNGSGKTSVLEAVKNKIYVICKGERDYSQSMIFVNNQINSLNPASENDKLKAIELKKNIIQFENSNNKNNFGVKLSFNSLADIISKYQDGNYIVAYYKADRIYKAEVAKNVEKIEFKDIYEIDEHPSAKFVKYLLDLKTSEALYEKKGDKNRAMEITAWFDRFEKLLRDIYDDPDLRLDFNIENFAFSILQTDREPFSFNEMSDGYAAILSIVSDLIMRMQKKSHIFYDLEGVVLIDEIETHLHLELQKNIIPMLTNIFPQIQFIMSTHSPFILNSAPNAVIYDLENHTLAEQGLANLPYEGIVEGFFGVDTLSDEMKEKFERYKEISAKDTLETDDYNELTGLEHYLDEIPDYLAVSFNEEYKRIKLELEARG